MSDDITSILLPSARVDIYALDDATSNLIKQLMMDWRFARVVMQSEYAGIEKAIDNYSHAPSPELIIIETNDISDAFIAELGKLAAVCAPGTDAVIIGPKNDVHLYRSLVEMGVKDYLVRPVSELDMVKVIARTLVEKRGLSGSRLVPVIGSKGGVGTTAIAQVLAYSIAEELKQKTLLLDIAGSSGSVGISYGLEPTTTMAEAVRLGASGTDDDIKRIIQAAAENLNILVSGGEPLLTDTPDADSIETMVNRLMQKYPVVVIDLSGATPSVQKRLLARASHTVVVSTPLLAALRNARTLLGEIKTLKSGLGDVDLIINKQGMAAGEEVPVKDIKAALDFDPTMIIPYLPKLFIASETSGKAVGADNLASKIMSDLISIAEKASSLKFKGVVSAKKDNVVDRFKKIISQK